MENFQQRITLVMQVVSLRPCIELVSVIYRRTLVKTQPDLELAVLVRSQATFTVNFYSDRDIAIRW